MFGKDKIVQLFNKKRVELSMSKGFALFNEGLYLYQEEKYDLAFEKFKQAEKLGYKSCDMYLCMSYVCDINEQRNVDLVLKYLDKAIKCDSDYGYAYFLKGATYSEYCDKYDLAIEYLLKAKKHDYESASLYYYLAKCYDNLDETMKALAAASTCISKYPDSYSGYMAKGNIYYYQNRYKEALPYLLKSEELGEVETSILFKISYSYSTLEDYKKALEYANKMIFLDKKNPVAYYRKGFVYYNQKDIEPALKNFLEAEKLGLDQNDWGGMYSRMSWIYQSKNDNEKALYYSNKALSYDIKDSFDYYRMGCLQMYGLENNTEALKYFKLALKHAEDDEAGQIDVYIDLSVLYMKLRKYTLALKTVNEGLEFPSKFNNEFLYRQKIAVLYKMNRFKECQKIVDYLLGIDANDFDPDEVITYVRKSGGEIIKRKGATFYGVANSVVDVCEALMGAQDLVTVVSYMMHGEYGVDDVCTSCLTVIGPNGVKGKIEATLTDEEVAKFKASAEALKAVIKEMDIE